MFLFVCLFVILSFQLQEAYMTYWHSWKIT